MISWLTKKYRPRRVRLKHVLSSNSKPICVFNYEGEKLYTNTQFNCDFDANKLYELIIKEKNKEKNKEALIWHCKYNEDNEATEFYDIVVTDNREMKMYVVFADYVNDTELQEFCNQYNSFIKAMYPKHIVDAILKKDLHNISRTHKNVTICFADIRGFTSTCSTMNPSDIMQFLNKLFGKFDLLLRKHDIFKLETVGDCYVTVSGLLTQNADGEYIIVDSQKDPTIAAENMVAFAKDMIATAYSTTIPGTNSNVEMRVGIHTGDVTSGIIDNEMPRFCLFGDAMNMASRMETTGKPMHIHVSEQTYALLRNKRCFVRQSVDVKGKGEKMTYYLNCTRRSTFSSCSMPSLQQLGNNNSFANLIKIVSLAVSNPKRKSFDVATLH